MRTLIIDHEDALREETLGMLLGMGHEGVAVGNLRAALDRMGEQPFDVALLNSRLNGKSGLEAMPKLQRRNPGLDVVIAAALASFESAVEAIRKGATDYLPKPFTSGQLRQVMFKIEQARKLRGRVADLESRLSTQVPEVDMTSLQPEMQQVFDVAAKAAAMPVTVLLLGESGTGKNVLARYIHENSPRREAPFVTVACPSLSRELLESELFGHAKGSFTGAVGETWGKIPAAEGGTLFLDEIGDLPMEIQPKLLRLLQEKQFERVGETKVCRADVRVIAATHRNLKDAVAAGQFREDLFYRINVMPLRLPSLRERPEDLLNIAQGYLRFCAAQCGKRVQGFSPAVQQALLRYEWPGNLRELRNLVERAVILTDGADVELCSLPPEVQAAGADTSGNPRVRLGDNCTLQELEMEHIRQVLRRTQAFEDAARILGIDSVTLYRKRKRYGIFSPSMLPGVAGRCGRDPVDAALSACG